MNRVLGYGMVLLSASAAVTWSARAAGLGASATEAGVVAGGALFFVGGSSAAPAHGAQGYLGVDVREVTEDQVAALKLKEARGAEIILVDHDAPAGKVGLREHDVVLQMNGQAIDSVDQIRRMLHESSPGKTIVLIVSREGQQITVTTQMANREEVERHAWEQHFTVPHDPSPLDGAGASLSSGANLPQAGVRGGNSFIGTMLMNPSYTGAMLEKMSSQLADFFGVPGGTGLLVRSVEANSPAALAGMHAGDVVIRANSRAVTSTGDWAKQIKNSHGRPLTVVVLRDKKEQTLILTPDGKKRSGLDQPTEDSERAVVAHSGFSWLPRS